MNIFLAKQVFIHVYFKSVEEANIRIKCSNKLAYQIKIHEKQRTA